LRYILKVFAAVAALATALTGPASATTYMFASTLNGGFDQGLLTGTFDLAGPATGIWTGAATNLKITAFPAGILLPEGSVATSWTQQITNSFTLNFGTISAYEFMALTAPATNPGLTTVQKQNLATELCMNNEHANLQGGGRGCAQGSVEIGQRSINYGFRTDAPLITFSAMAPIGDGVPEPGAWMLMLAGFGAAGIALRQRRTHVSERPKPAASANGRPSGALLHSMI
jgi:hypothetical protein